VKYVHDSVHPGGFLLVRYVRSAALPSGTNRVQHRKICASRVRQFSAVRTFKSLAPVSNNPYFLLMNFFRPENKIEVITAVPGSEILGPNLRTYDKNYSQRYISHGGPKVLVLVVTDLAYAPGQPGRFCRGLGLF
jgi:hypothetical protein